MPGRHSVIRILGAAIASVLVAVPGVSVAHADAVTKGTATINISWFDMQFCSTWADTPILPGPPTCPLKYSYTETEQMQAAVAVGPPITAQSRLGDTQEKNPFDLQLVAADSAQPHQKWFRLSSAIQIQDPNDPGAGWSVSPYWKMTVVSRTEFDGAWAYGGPWVDPVGGSNSWNDTSCAGYYVAAHYLEEFNTGIAPPDSGWKATTPVFTATVANGQTTIAFEAWIGPVCEVGQSQFGPAWEPQTDGFIQAQFTFPGDITGGQLNPPNPTPTPNPSPNPTTPASVTITTMKIRARQHTGTFTFIGRGGATGFQCALVKLPKQGKVPKPKYGTCRSPITYKRLRTGKYSFYVRALGANRSLSKPAQRTFKMT